MKYRLSSVSFVLYRHQDRHCPQRILFPLSAFKKVFLWQIFFYHAAEIFDFEKKLKAKTIRNVRLVLRLFEQTHSIAGSGGGVRGRAVAFCLSMPSLNPRTDLGFFGSELLSIYSC